jgi:DNA-binding MarR family transcriptional regulator
MTQDIKPKLPIGYWLKLADNLLTEQIDKAQAIHGVSRSDWQILNILKENGRASREQIFETMHTFIDASNFNNIITSLIERGWVEQRQLSNVGMEQFQLTKEGQRRHEAIFATQKEVRQRAMQGISEEEYATVIRVLQQMVTNLSGERVEAG